MNLEMMTPEELDSKALLGDFELMPLTFKEHSNHSRPCLRGGWDCMWIATKGEGFRGALVMIPRDERTGDVYRQGLINYAVGLGLSLDSASKWAKYRGKYKHELVHDLVLVSKSINLYNAFAEYPGYGLGKGRTRWLEKWQIDKEWMSAPRQFELNNMIQECLVHNEP